MKITIFSEELRKCLNAAGLSDCGENDTWNYWYQRLMNAYNESVERQIMTEQTENDKLRELCGRALAVIENNCGACAYFYDCDIMNDCKCVAPKKIRDELRELGVEISE